MYLSKVHSVQQLFDQLSASTLRTYEPIMKNSFSLRYSTSQVKIIRSYLKKIVTVRTENSKKVIQVFKQLIPKKKNPWLKKAAQILALNTRVNTQKSFWRLRYNVYFKKGVVPANFVVALKKLYNYLHK